MKAALASVCLLAVVAFPSVARGAVVLSPREGDNAPALRSALETLREQHGGDLVLNPGVYVIGAQLSLDGLSDVRIVGRGEAVLRLAAERHTRTTRDAAQGDTELYVRRPDAFVPGLALEIQRATRQAPAPAGEVRPTPYVDNTVREVLADRLVLARPLTADVPADSPVLHPMNVFDGRRDIRNLTIQNLVLDLNRDAWPVAPVNHGRHSGVFLYGPFDYETGPTGAPLEGVRIIDCTIKNAHHRGVAFYNVRNSGVYHCRIENTGAEGIDFDHFVTHSQAVGNTLVDCRNIELNDASDCLVADNVLRGCRGGIVVWQWCRLPDLNRRNLILRNTFEDCAAPAVVLRHGADRNTVLGNAGRFAEGPALVVDGTGNWIGDNPFRVDRGPAARVGPGNAGAGVPAP